MILREIGTPRGPPPSRAAGPCLAGADPAAEFQPITSRVSLRFDVTALQH